MLDMILNNIFKLKNPFLHWIVILLRKVKSFTLWRNNDKPEQKSSVFVKKNYQGACL